MVVNRITKLEMRIACFGVEETNVSKITLVHTRTSSAVYVLNCFQMSSPETDVNND